MRDRAVGYIDDSQRVEFIDIAKGISIVLVVIYHSRLGQLAPELLQGLGLFRLPLFFFVAGIFFSYAQTPEALIRKKSDALLKPYFVTVGLAYLAKALWLGAPIEGLAVNLLYGTRLGKGVFPAWFLPHLFLVSLFAYLVVQKLALERRPELHRWAILGIMLLTGSLLLGLAPRMRHPLPFEDVILLGLPWGLDLVLVTSSFFLAGSLLKNRILEWRHTSPGLVVVAIAFLACILQLTDARTDFYAGVYSNALLCTVAAACGIFLTLSLARRLVAFPLLHQALRIAGQSGLFILLFHRFIELVFLQLTRIVALERTTLLYVVSLMLSLAVPVWMRAFAHRYTISRSLFFPRRRVASE